MGFLDKGSRIQHRNLGFVVRIQEVVDGRYRLVWDRITSEDLKQETLFHHVFRTTFSALDLVRDFVPLVEETKWDRLLDGGSPIDADPYTPRGVSHPLQGI
jgi:hypothetical protein